MPITEILEKNARKYGPEIALVEINPEVREDRRVTWKEYELIERGASEEFRREITWGVFDEKANRCANLLLSRGIKKGDKVAILLMNCLEWLPLYFGILKTGALVVPMNYRYSADEIQYCADLADVDAMFFGPEFIGRIAEVHRNGDAAGLKDTEIDRQILQAVHHEDGDLRAPLDAPAQQQVGKAVGAAVKVLPAHLAAVRGVRRRLLDEACLAPVRRRVAVVAGVQLHQGDVPAPEPCVSFQEFRNDHFVCFLPLFQSFVYMHKKALCVRKRTQRAN